MLNAIHIPGRIYEQNLIVIKISCDIILFLMYFVLFMHTKVTSDVLLVIFLFLKYCTLDAIWQTKDIFIF